MDFQYSEWFRDVSTLGEPCDDVFAYVYTPDFGKGLDSTGTLVPFLSRGMVVRRMPADLSLVRKHPGRYTHGAYVVSDAKRNLFVVDVARKTVVDDDSDRGEAVLYVADHFSFFVNKGDPRGLKLHAHRTEYLPANSTQGSTVRFKNPLRLAFRLPASAQEFVGSDMVHPQMRRNAAWLYDVLRMAAPTDVVVGGGSKTRGRRTAQRDCRDFDDVWQFLPLRSMLIVAVPNPDAPGRHDVTVFLRHRLGTGRDVLESCRSYFARMSSRDAANEAKVQDAVADCMRGLTHDDFRGDLVGTSGR